jgi:hypothetical protein
MQIDAYYLVFPDPGKTTGQVLQDYSPECERKTKKAIPCINKEPGRLSRIQGK